MALRYSLGDARTFIIMLMRGCTTVVMNTVCKAAMSKGMSNLVLTVYSYALATLLSSRFPSSSTEQHVLRSPSASSEEFSFSPYLRTVTEFISTAMTCGYAGLRYSSLALSAAMGNLVPAFTLILAIITRQHTHMQFALVLLYGAYTRRGPLEIFIAFLRGFLFLGETINLGSLIGAIIIVIGFYAVMWGKAKEEDIVVGNSMIGTLESTSQNVPLLQDSKPVFGDSSMI